MKVFNIVFVVALSFLLSACGGGGGSSNDASPPPPVSKYSTTMNVDSGTLVYETSRATLLDTPAAYHPNIEVDFDVISNGYFTQNPDAHFVICTRCDLTHLDSAIFGSGLLFGNVSKAASPTANQLHPSTQLETWFNGIGNGNQLLVGNPNPPILVDGIKYHVSYFSSLGEVSTVRYTVSVNNSVIYDSGDVVDPNKYYNVNNNGIVIGHVFDAPGNWSIVLSNVDYKY